MLTVSHAHHMLVTYTSHAVCHGFAGHNGYISVHTKVCVCVNPMHSHMYVCTYVCMWVGVHTYQSHAGHMHICIYSYLTNHMLVTCIYACTHISLITCWSYTPCLHVMPSSLSRSCCCQACHKLTWPIGEQTRSMGQNTVQSTPL